MVPKPVSDPSPKGFDPSKKYTFHYDAPRHDIENCWTLKNKIWDLIDGNVIQIPKKVSPNITVYPLPPLNDLIENYIVEDEEDDDDILDELALEMHQRLLLKTLIQYETLPKQKSHLITRVSTMEKLLFTPWRIVGSSRPRSFSS